MKLLIENFKKFLNEDSDMSKLVRLTRAGRLGAAVEFALAKGDDFFDDFVLELAKMFTLDAGTKDDLEMVFLEIVMNGSENEKKHLQDLYNKIFEKMAPLEQLERDVDDEFAWSETEERKILNRLRKLQREIGGISRDMGPKKPGELQ